jgi:TPR repeat protein
MLRRALLVLIIFQWAHAFADGPIYSGVKNGRAAFIRKKQAACDGGDAASCIKLGELYQKAFYATDSEPSDGENAFRFYQRACKLGSVDGCRDMAWCYDEGMGVAHDQSRAENLYQQGCDGGDMASCGLLGSLYDADTDRGWANVKQDIGRARKLFERVCSGKIDGLGCLSGCDELASDYYYGSRGFTKNLGEALRLYQRACDAGCSNSCDSGARMLRDGDGVAIDVAIAAKMYQRACDIGLTPSCVDLGEMYRDGIGVAKNRERARQLFLRGCRHSRGQVERCQGDPEAGPLLKTL